MHGKGERLFCYFLSKWKIQFYIHYQHKTSDPGKRLVQVQRKGRHDLDPLEKLF
jgi:hypothetical protein